MSKRPSATRFDVSEFCSTLSALGRSGVIRSRSQSVSASLEKLHLISGGDGQDVVATNLLFSLGTTRSKTSALRRVMSLEPEYRVHLLNLLLEAVSALPDDRSLAETIEQLDNLSPELLELAGDSAERESNDQFGEWDASIWQAPDAVTLLSKVVEAPEDFATQPEGPTISVGFDWLAWETPPKSPAPAPWADPEPLSSPLATARHPFWGAMVATLDACTGDYEWQSLILRGGMLRSQHRTLGKAPVVIESLWRRELGLYPVPPLIVTGSIPFTPGQPLPWLQLSLEQLADKGVAVESEGSWRLTDGFRTELMKDDEHMIAFEAIRQRAYRLARAAEKMTEPTNEVVAS